VSQTFSSSGWRGSLLGPRFFFCQTVQHFREILKTIS
jgi:hypothetical protein